MPNVSVNGNDHRAAPEHAHVAEFLRVGLGLTGTKVACGHGACGACVIHVDGVPVASCLLPAAAVAGRDIRTIEAIGGERLHPVQLAFMAHDALQCGFCTPGFVMESVAFHDAWRADRGTSTPTRDDVARALAGHLCRCAAYEGIYAAVRAACAGEFDHVTRVSAARPDALDKVTGRARYTVDVHHDDMQWGRIVRSTVAHGDVVAVDPTAALALAGVTAYIDLMGAVTRVRYLGQPIGAVAANDRAAAVRGADLVEVTYDCKPAVFDVDAALSADAPQIHGWGWSPPNSNEGRDLPNVRRGNRRGPNTLLSVNPIRARRRIAERRSNAPHRIVEGRWTASVQVHTPLEPHVTVAWWTSDATLEVHTSTQGVTAAREQIAERYDLELADVTVLAHDVGGAFGAKQLIDTDVVAAVELARETGTPVRVEFDRNEELSYAGHRPGSSMDLAVAADDRDAISAISFRSMANGGASGGQSIASLTRFNYPTVPQALSDFDVLTNLPAGKAFRAPGGPLTAWALEQAIDELAEQVDVDPIVMRELSDPSAGRFRVYEAARTSELWSHRTLDRSQGRFRRGIGVAFGSWIYVYDPRSQATVETKNGQVVVSVAAQDMGNGTRGMVASAAGRVFGLSPAAVEVALGDAALGHGPLSSGSRTTASLWPSVREAAEMLRTQLAEGARTELGMEGAVPVEGGLEHEGELVEWADLIRRLPPRTATAVRPDDRFVPIWRRGITWIMLRAVVTRGEPGMGLSHGATVVEVEVDTRLGRIRPVRAHAIVSAGAIHSPVLARSQVHGGVVQGLGYALCEERRIDPVSGRNLTANMEDYRIPGIADAPEISVDFLEGGFDHVSGGGIGMSELCTVSVAAAAGNAVANATGWRPRNLPMRPDRVVEALR